MTPIGRGAGLAVLLIAAGCVSAPESPPATPPAPEPQPKPASIRGDFALDGRFSQGGWAIGTAPEGAVSLMLDGKPVRMDGARRFLIGFDRDAGTSATLIATAADGSTRVRAFSIGPRAWDIQSLPTLPRGTTPTPEFLKRRADEQAQIAAARAMNPATDGWRTRFAWPVTGRISGVFGSQRIYAGEPGAYHSGVDIARPTGTPVGAPADGVVILATASPFTIEGNLILIDHGMGLNSALMHLSRIDVKVGDRVAQGQIVGAIGSTGRATGPHLHWGLKWNDARIDPQLLAGAMP